MTPGFPLELYDRLGSPSPDGHVTITAEEGRALRKFLEGMNRLDALLKTVDIAKLPEKQAVALSAFLKRG